MSSPARPSAARIAAAATLACALEACAEKVGNVTPTRGFAGRPLRRLRPERAGARGRGGGGRAPGKSAGRCIARSPHGPRVAPSNTNLGMALLFAPLAAAARARGGMGLRVRLARVLRDLDVDDARWAYRAIRLARPGGLGRADRADVARPPAVTLRQAMRLAAGRDTVAAGVRAGLRRHVRPGAGRPPPGDPPRPRAARRHRAGPSRADGPGPGHADRAQGRCRRRGGGGRGARARWSGRAGS